ncbi:MAG: dGTPase [Endozoicomonadaceae bacterium]|nr:dGTPase [Endozoicomonadaceae bacterium]
MDYRKKITTKRPRSSSVTKERDIVDETESNRGRIIQSSAIRRLQKKTQVYPLEMNAAVRSRLTHSLEVQQTGRFIARLILAKFREIKQLAPLGLAGIETAFVNLVEMSCLMHDVGNPPFGHFGEAAINAWMKKQSTTCYQAAMGMAKPSKLFREVLLPDLYTFEGNAQGVRIVTTLQALNLTYSQIAALIKYTRPSYRPQASCDASLEYLNRKPGYYYAEESLIKDIWNHLGIDDNHRYPLTYIMEAADDISYCIADLEDAVDKGILTLIELRGYLNEEWDKQKGHDQNDYLPNIIKDATKPGTPDDVTPDDFIMRFRTRLVNDLADYAAQRYIECHEQIFVGSLNEPLIGGESKQHLALKILKQVALKHVFSSNEVETLELRGYAAIQGLLDIYRPLMEVSRDEMALIVQKQPSDCLIASRLFHRLPDRYVAVYRKATKEVSERQHSDQQELEWYYRMRLLMDYISGMTDDFLLMEFQCLSAI